MEQRLLQEGFFFTRQKGIWRRFKHPDGRTVAIPQSPSQVPLPAQRTIYRQAGWPWYQPSTPDSEPVMPVAPFRPTLVPPPPEPVVTYTDEEIVDIVLFDAEHGAEATLRHFAPITASQLDAWRTALTPQEAASPEESPMPSPQKESVPKRKKRVPDAAQRSAHEAAQRLLNGESPPNVGPAMGRSKSYGYNVYNGMCDHMLDAPTAQRLVDLREGKPPYPTPRRSTSSGAPKTPKAPVTSLPPTTSPTKQRRKNVSAATVQRNSRKVAIYILSGRTPTAAALEAGMHRSYGGQLFNGRYDKYLQPHLLKRLVKLRQRIDALRSRTPHLTYKALFARAAKGGGKQRVAKDPYEAARALGDVQALATAGVPVAEAATLAGLDHPKAEESTDASREMQALKQENEHLRRALVDATLNVQLLKEILAAVVPKHP